ncbi:hypothetical protein H4219_005209 [Mycoemilia scoparia]|uniref:Uncharacterized protein n=1 Tax=Mycoemilia scoparia TaxID=417184 RepID=A0A9W7ZPY4_9FUNG|nr:hypothetical protein H4219_005209 [Mycoemilia scoparia]
MFHYIKPDGHLSVVAVNSLLTQALNPAFVLFATFWCIILPEAYRHSRANIKLTVNMFMDMPYFTNVHDGSPASGQIPSVETTGMSHHNEQGNQSTDLDSIVSGIGNMNLTNPGTTNNTTNPVPPHVLPRNEQHDGNVPQGGQNGVVHELYINDRPILHAPKNFDELWQMVKGLIQWRGQETVDEVKQMVQRFAPHKCLCHLNDDKVDKDEDDEVNRDDEDDEDEDEDDEDEE